MSFRNPTKSSIDIIKLIYVPHCARGPKRCELCKKALNDKKICHLRLYTHAGNVTRPVMEYVIHGKQGYFEYDVIKIFPSIEEAKKYAEKNGIAEWDLESH
ncbi:MAG: hypothetical protein GF411_00530 [Candidatus Lokiarchaeota archaeon]|nr:hypothetical protein [Candidatus Lokiarchaeota archaeon]